MPWLVLFLACQVGCTRQSADAPMVDVDEGTFLMGCNDGPECDEPTLAVARPSREVFISAFAIDRHEVTADEYWECSRAGVCLFENHGGEPLCNYEMRDEGGTYRLDERDNHPFNCVTWEQAATYCEWRDKRLPTEAEWEKAARGTDGRRYPWGGSPEPTCGLLVFAGTGCSLGGTSPVETRPDGVSPYGAHDMAGNVFEWVADRYSNNYAGHSNNDPQGPNDQNAWSSHGVRGGSWAQGPAADTRRSTRVDAFRTYSRYVLVGPWWPSVGFRCARSSTPTDRQ